MKLDTLFENFEMLADAPIGIPKLREMILQLAVQGKLVPQDPKNEPASVLLEKIKAEKDRLIKEKKVKKTRPLTPIKDKEIPYELPEGWEWTRLDTICSYIQRGKGPKYAEKSNIPVISQKCIQWEGFQIERARFIDPISLKKYAEERFLQSGDLLWNSTGTGTIGRVNVYRHENIPYEKVVADSHVTVVRPIFLDSDFLWCFIANPIIQYGFEDRASGTTNQIELNTSTVKSQIIPTPPLDEQKRIVAKVDQLMALCDELEARKQKRDESRIVLNDASLDRLLSAQNQKDFDKHWSRIRNNFDLLYDNPENVGKLRQAILQLAVQGKLVPQDPNDLPAPRPGVWFVYALECEDRSIYIGQTQDILKRWKQHATGMGADWTKRPPPVKLVHWEDYDSLEKAVKREKDLKTASGQKWLKQEYAAGRTRQAGEPASILLEKIKAEKDRLLKEKKIKKIKPLPPIEADDLPYELPGSWEWVRLGDLIHVSSGNFLPRHKMIDGEIPVYGGNGVTGYHNSYNVDNQTIVIGRVGFYCGSIHLTPNKAWVTDNAFITYYPERYIDQALLVWLLRATNLQTNTSSTAQPVISGGKIYPLMIQLPPLKEQRRIVAKVDQLMALCDEMETKLSQSQSNCDELLSAIVNNKETR